MGELKGEEPFNLKPFNFKNKCVLTPSINLVFVWLSNLLSFVKD